jgi:hypothetical protein
MAEKKLNGETWDEWADRLFEFNYCDSCGKDKEDHIPGSFFGNWFAWCKEGTNDDPLTR